jgi:hypothetical protein
MNRSIDTHTCPDDHNPLHCILPPHLLERLAQHSPDEVVRREALYSLSTDASIRAARWADQTLRAEPATAMPSLTAHLQRYMYTANQGQTLPGTLIRSEGQPPTGDAAIDEAYDGFGATFGLFWDVYGRNSIDNAGMDLKGTAHYGNLYNNAFWNGTQMVFGDGDPAFFNRFTIAIDIIGHELTHGVTGYEAGLEYHDQPGALNESLSDVFGSLVKQRALHQTAAQADWLIGAGLLAKTINGKALRSMKAPGTAYDDPLLGKDPQPDHMSKYVQTTRDNGGVHINSGIPNKAFYLAAIGLGGNAWDQAGHIWYQTLTDPRMSSTAQFVDFANLTVETADRLYGSGVATTVVEAWRQVGIDVTSAAPRISGNWMLHYSWGATNSYAQIMLTFNGNGTFTGPLSGRWHQQDGTMLLSFDTGPAKYAGSIDGSVGSGAMSTFTGSNGAWYLTKQGTVGIVRTVTALQSGLIDAAGTELVAAPPAAKRPKAAAGHR